MDNWEVNGLWLGAKGTAGPFLLNFFKSHDIPERNLVEMCLTVLKDTNLNNHLYS